MAGLKGLRGFQRFDIRGFLAGKQLLLMGMEDLRDHESRKIIGARLKTIILTDDTIYSKDGLNNEGSELNVKTEGLDAQVVDRNNRSFIKLRNPSATIYGDFQNMLSVKADGFDYVDDKKNGKK